MRIWWMAGSSKARSSSSSPSRASPICSSTSPSPAATPPVWSGPSRSTTRSAAGHLQLDPVTGGGLGELAPGDIVDGNAFSHAPGPHLALRVAGNENRSGRIPRRRGGNAARDGLDLLPQPGLIDQAAGIEDEGEHVVGDGVMALVLRGQGTAAGDDPGEELADEGQRIALMLAHGQDSAARLAEQRAGIGRGPSGPVQQQIGRELPALIGG